MSDRREGLTSGIDLGKASIGFAVVDFSQERVVHLASHFFDAPEVGTKKESAAAKRRAFRSSRHRLERAKTRKAHCRQILIDAGLVPADADSYWFEVRKGDLKVVELRARALDEAVTPRDLARILYHFACSRQYIGQSAGAEGAANKDGRAVLGALGANQKELDGTGCRSWGELLHRKYLETGRSTDSAGDYTLCVAHELIRQEAEYIVKRPTWTRRDDFINALMETVQE